MKRFYTLALGLMMGATTLFAQKTTDLQFVTINEDNVETGVVKDGAIIDATEETPLGITSGLAIKNVSGSAQKNLLCFEILEIDNGNITCCFNVCKNYTDLGKNYQPEFVMDGEYYMANSFKVLKSGDFKDLQTEWAAASKGKCVVKFTAYQGVVDEDTSDSVTKFYNLVEGPSVTVNFLNGVPSTGISNIENQSVDNNYYDLAGRKVAKPTKGIYVKNNKKVVVK